MNRTKLAIFIAMASGFTAALAHAQTTKLTPSAYEYGNYDYYSQAGAPAAPSDPMTPAPSTAPVASPAASYGCNSTCGCENACGCNNGCGCNSCCNSCCDHCRCCPRLHGCLSCCECCPLECEEDELCRCIDCCCLKCRNITIGGWLDAGITGQDRASADRFNGPLTFGDRRGEGQFNQAWIFAERATPEDNCGWYIGGRVDFFYGSDFLFTTAAGLDGTPVGNVPRWNTDPRLMYGFAMPQLYFTTDLDTDWKIKYGHFFTIIGYEVVPAIGNFFYSHAYTMQYGEPFTHTGILATNQWCEYWSWSLGITSGWDTFDANARANLLAGINYTDKDYGSLAFAIASGDNSVSGLPGTAPFANRTNYSLVWSRNFSSRITYVLQHDYAIQDNAATASGTTDAEWYGLNQYLFYKINCCWTAGARVEWFKDDDGFRVTGLRPGNAIAGASFPGDFYEATVGLNYKPNANLAVRGELRWDWYDGLPNQNGAVTATLPYNAGTADNMFTYAIDLIYQF